MCKRSLETTHMCPVPCTRKNKKAFHFGGPSTLFTTTHSNLERYFLPSWLHPPAAYWVQFHMGSLKCFSNLIATFSSGHSNWLYQKRNGKQETWVGNQAYFLLSQSHQRAHLLLLVTGLLTLDWLLELLSVHYINLQLGWLAQYISLVCSPTKEKYYLKLDW